MELYNFDQLIEKAKTLPRKGVVAVAAAADRHAVEAVLEGKENGVAEPILVGDAAKIREILRELDRNPSDFNIVGTAAGMNEAETAVELVKDGSAGFLMKGMIETSDFLRPVVKKENGLRTGRTTSHLAFNKFDGYHKIICNTDGGVTPHPTLQQKREIVINAVEAFHKLGYELPKIACLCCKESYDPKMPETTDARALQEMCERGEFGKCAVYGPLSYDIAMSREISREKHFDCPYCGDFDILLQPNIHAGNILGKCWAVSCGAAMVGIIVGCKVPLILVSRSSSAWEKYLSLALAAVVAAEKA